MKQKLSEYLEPTEYIESNNPEIIRFSKAIVTSATDERQAAINIYYAIRDDIIYDPYFIGDNPNFFRASACLSNKRGFCIPKAALMTACLRQAGIPARVGYADVRNHLTTPKLASLTEIDIYMWHGYSEVYLENRWVKVTPIFNLSLCERFKVKALDFNGHDDSLFQEHDQLGRRHMEYVNERGYFVDVPYELIIDDFRKYYPKWLSNGPELSLESNDFL